MFRLRLTSVAGFPRCGSTSVRLALRPIPPRQTGRAVLPHPAFPETPALGTRRELHALNSHRYSRTVVRIHQPQTLQVFVECSPFRHSKGALTPLLYCAILFRR